MNNEDKAQVFMGHLEYSSLMPAPERWVRARDYETLVVVYDAELLANKILIERDASFTAEIAKLKEALELGAQASATLRDESLTFQAEWAELKKRAPLMGGVPVAQFLQAEVITTLQAVLRKAVNYYTGHFGWCAKNGQMPMEIGRQYTHPQDCDAWRATVACTCEVAMLPEVKTPCCIHEHDGAYKCYAHNKKWGAISNPDVPCAGWDEKGAQQL